MIAQNFAKLLICAFLSLFLTKSFATPSAVFIKSIGHLDQVLTNNIFSGTGPVLTWDRTQFQNEEAAEVVLDAMLFLQDNGIWILPDGRYLHWVDVPEQILFVNPSHQIDKESRKSLAKSWLVSRVLALRKPSYVLQVLAHSNHSAEIDFVYEIFDFYKTHLEWSEELYSMNDLYRTQPEFLDSLMDMVMRKQIEDCEKVLGYISPGTKGFRPLVKKPKKS